MLRLISNSSLLYSLLISLVCFWTVSCEREQQAPPPNVVLIYVDDMGWKDLGFMGSRYYETPHIDSLARMGMVFRHGYAPAANCAPSRASLMTGLWTPRHGIYTVNSSERGESRHRRLIPVQNATTLNRRHTVFPDLLQDKGYATCQAGKWHLSDDPVDYGFDLSIGGTRAGHPRSYYPPYGNVPLQGEDYLTDLIMDHTLKFVDTVQSPFLLYYSPYAVHTPLQPVRDLLPKYESKSTWNGQGNAAYGTMVENLDRNIGRLISGLKKKGVFDRTVIVFTSDNGGLYGITTQQPLRAGKGSYYEGGIRIPFFVVWPGSVAPGTESEVPVTHLDLFPTLMEITGGYPGAGTPDAEKLNLDGISLVPLLLRKEEGMERSLFWHFPVYLQAYNAAQNENRDSLFRTRPGSVIRKGEWKLHYYFEDDGTELYHLGVDPGERNNLADREDGKREELIGELREWWEETGAPIPREPNPEFVPYPPSQP